jgi:citrate lyase beta subunit
LFCPSDRPDRFGKAADAGDTIVLDLEDAVAPEHKERARGEVHPDARRLDPARIVVREARLLVKRLRSGIGQRFSGRRQTFC